MQRLLPFYRDGLGLHVLGRFEQHEGFDGIMLGRQGSPYHFEFTCKHGHDALRSPSEDNLLVFYIPDRESYEVCLERMKKAGFQAVRSYNPYWDRGGTTFEDPDGYRVVFYNGAWIV